MIGDKQNANWKDISDERLMERFCQGDSAAFEELFCRYKKRIYNYVYRFLGNAAQSEEVVQEGFLKLINLRERYKQSAKFSTLFYTIMRNLCIDNLRRSAHQRIIRPNDEDDSPLVEKIAAVDVKPPELIHQKQLEAILQQAIRNLNPPLREVFLMREKLALPFAEIAHVLGCSENTVKSRMRYALENLRKYLSQYYNVKDLVS